VIVLVTAPAADAKKLQETLVKEGLAACINLVPVDSFFTWKGKQEGTHELLLLMKTKTALFEELEKRVKELHPYEVPEILAIPILKGSSSYLKWIDEVTK